VILVACALAAVLIWAGAFYVGALHDADAEVLRFLTGYDDTPVEFFSESVVDLIQPLLYGPACAVLLWLGWRRRGLREAATAGALILGANVTTQLLKQALAEPRFYPGLLRQIDPASWPSGHATASASLALAAYLLFPRTRPYGIAFALAVGVAVVANSWHYPSDVLGGYAVAGGWAAVAAITLRRPAATVAPRRRWLRATG
jgi:membrane-associated phospholipid phosphatase